MFIQLQVAKIGKFYPHQNCQNWILNIPEKFASWLSVIKHFFPEHSDQHVHIFYIIIKIFPAKVPWLNFSPKPHTWKFGPVIKLLFIFLFPVMHPQWKIVWWTRSNFLGLFPKSVKDQWHCEIGNYYLHFPYNYYSTITMAQNILKVARLHDCASLRNSTWFTRLWEVGIWLWHYSTFIHLWPLKHNSNSQKWSTLAQICIYTLCYW